MAASKAAALPLGHSPTFQNVFYSINCLKGESSKLLTNTDELNFSFALSASSLLEKLIKIVEPVPDSLGFPIVSSKLKRSLISLYFCLAQSSKVLKALPCRKSFLFI